MNENEVVNEKRYTLVTIGSRLDAFLKPILKNAGFNIQYQLSEGVSPHPEIENPEIMVRFSGPDVEFLLANKAELLLSLEQLTMEMLRMPSQDHSLLCFDAHDYRMLRIEELRLSAITAADKVKKSRIPFHFNPMSSRERRIIHLVLRNEPSLRSESVGSGPFRQVVIVPSDMPTPPAPPPPPFRSGPPRGPSGPGRRSGPPRRDRRH